MSPVPGLTPLPYAVGRAGSPWGWRVAFWLGVVYLAVLVVLMVLQVRPVLMMARMLADAPRREPFVIAMALMQTTSAAMALANVLPVAGYSLAARGRSPRRLFIVYVAVQCSLAAIFMLAAICAVWMGSVTFNTPTNSSSVGVSPLALVIVLVAILVLSVPLVALLVPKIRRGCLGTTSGREE